MSSAASEQSDAQTIDAFRRRWPNIEPRELEVLLTATLNLSRASLIAHPDRVIERSLIAQLEAAARRLQAGEPIAYVLGYRDFYDLRLSVDPSVLIPRPETELLVELARDRLHPDAKVLELGTGSGAIAIALADRFDVLATDVSEAALATAQRNATSCGRSVRFARSNWFDEIEGRFDAIVSNPPYIAPDHPALVSLSYEPTSALVAADGGLADLRAIINGAPDHMINAGLLLLEHGYDQGERLQAMLRAAGWDEITQHQDLAGLDRVVSAVWSTGGVV